MSDAVRLVKIEKGNEEFNKVAVACGWDSGDQMYNELVDDEDLGTEISNGLYLPAEEVGYRKSKSGMIANDDVDVLCFIGSEFGNRFFINRNESYLDKAGNLWVDERSAHEF